MAEHFKLNEVAGRAFDSMLPDGAGDFRHLLQVVGCVKRNGYGVQILVSLRDGVLGTDTEGILLGKSSKMEGEK